MRFLQRLGAGIAAMSLLAGCSTVEPGLEGTVLHVGDQLKGLTKPSRTDERAFYMASVLNAVAREGYELVGMHPDEFVVRRPAQPAN